MIEYNSQTTAKVTSKSYTFFLDSGEAGLPEHSILLEDFKDEKKLSKFIQMLEEDHETAYTRYLSERK